MVYKAIMWILHYAVILAEISLFPLEWSQAALKGLQLAAAGAVCACD